MADHRKLPLREHVFILSLQYHGFRFVRRRKRLKKKKGYIIPATKQEDASLIDFWVKMPGHTELIPVQVTQRGTAIFRRRHKAAAEREAEFARLSSRRLRFKHRACIRYRIAFVLVRDHTGIKPSKSIAWGDKKALEYGVRALAA